MILVGNKCDLSDSRIVSSDSGQLLANSLGIKFMETSAKTNSNVEEVWYYVSLSTIVLT